MPMPALSQTVVKELLPGQRCPIYFTRTFSNHSMARARMTSRLPEFFRQIGVKALVEFRYDRSSKPRIMHTGRPLIRKGWEHGHKAEA